MRHLINEKGEVFDGTELGAIRLGLAKYGDLDREAYRNSNSASIASHAAERILLVSGPGTGKSHLFKDRILHWFTQDSTANILVTSFVRKLVADLQVDVNDDKRLSPEQKESISVSTLHKFARRIVELSHGTAQWRFKPHFRIIGVWEHHVWADVMQFFPHLDIKTFSWMSFQDQMHNANFLDVPEWESIKDKYFEICRFYNAAGFADLILRASIALAEDSTLNSSKYFIVDEYQDFNAAENQFLQQLYVSPQGIFVVGDDDQVLYQSRSGNPSLIRNLYKDSNYVKAMLPYCGRSSVEIVTSASYFIDKARVPDSIEKIYLPLRLKDELPRVQLIGCAQPGTAVAFIKDFVDDHIEEIEERQKAIEANQSKEAFLLILTPSKGAPFFEDAGDVIKEIVERYRPAGTKFSEDYYKLLTYLSLANYPKNNFTFRKILFYEGKEIGEVHRLVVTAIGQGKDISEVDEKQVRDIINKCTSVKETLESEKLGADEKIQRIGELITVSDPEVLKAEIEISSFGAKEILELEYEEDEDAELRELEVVKTGAVDLLTIVGSKGLSADHVIIVGFDDVNFKYITRNAFYVSLTRARKSLQIITSLQCRGSSEPHHYLNELSDHAIEFSKYTKKKGFERFANRNIFLRYFRGVQYARKMSAAKK